MLSTKYSDTSAKLQDLSPVLDDGTLLYGLDNVINTTDLKVSFVTSEMRDKSGVDAATLANNWGIGIEDTKRTRLVTTQRGIIRMIHPSLTTTACKSQCLLTQCTQQSSQGNIIKQLIYCVLILVL
jgi:hypothetical protein